MKSVLSAKNAFWPRAASRAHPGEIHATNKRCIVLTLRGANRLVSATTSTDFRVPRPHAAFTGPGPQVDGLQAVPEGLLCDQRNNDSYLVHDSCRVLKSLASPARDASGISFGAQSVCVGSNVDQPMIFRHDPSSGQCTAFLMLEVRTACTTCSGDPTARRTHRRLVRGRAPNCLPLPRPTNVTPPQV